MGALAEQVVKYQPKIQNTWGDSIFLVFGTADKAAACALALRDTIRNTVWPSEGIYSDLKMRIALHNAHANLLKDPITKQQNAYGPHINMAARLEPVATPNEVFATEEFKRALDTFGLKVYEWDDMGTLPLAKDWGESTVYRLRRPSEQKLVSKTTNIDHTSLDKIMPNMRALLLANEVAKSEITRLGEYIDSHLLESGIFRRNWLIQVAYDVMNLRKFGTIKEDIRWSYELINLRNTPVEYSLRFVGAPSLEGKTGLISWHEISEDGREKRLKLGTSSGTKGPMFELRQTSIALLPKVSNKIEIRVEQTWPVNRERPVIHNSWASTQVCSGKNRLEIVAPVEKLGVLFGGKELDPAFRKGQSFVYNIPSPMLRDQKIEVMLNFRIN